MEDRFPSTIFYILDYIRKPRTRQMGSCHMSWCALFIGGPTDWWSYIYMNDKMLQLIKL